MVSVDITCLSTKRYSVYLSGRATHSSILLRRETYMKGIYPIAHSQSQDIINLSRLPVALDVHDISYMKPLSRFEKSPLGVPGPSLSEVPRSMVDLNLIARPVSSCHTKVRARTSCWWSAPSWLPTPQAPRRVMRPSCWVGSGQRRAVHPMMTIRPLCTLKPTTWDADHPHSWDCCLNPYPWKTGS
jgi:hypothetical protein